ncbi:hypothetical protein ACFVH0_16185 [Streptomyces sp. NPDC127117]|uniref:hypothetical protein n=1 Tax=Streptomyces sp. NPDC127117 TaxID=3345368 RepID=UPI003639009A
MPVAPAPAALPAVTGTATVVCLAVQARLRRGQKQREEEVRWSMLFPVRTSGRAETAEEE